MFKTLSAVAIAALTMVGSAQATLISTVDLFTTAQAKLIDTTVGGAISSEVGGALDTTILGGFRELILDQKTGDGVAESSIQVAGGALRFANEPGAGSTGIVRWDGASAPTGGVINHTGLGGIDLGNVFTDSFELQIISADGAYFFQIDAYTSATQWSSVKIAANVHPFPGITSYIPLAAFLDCTNSVPPGPPLVTVTCGAGGAVDFDNLGALQAVIDVDGTAVDLDLRLNQVTVVPEPNAIALVGLALLGAGFASRRRKV